MISPTIVSCRTERRMLDIAVDHPRVKHHPQLLRIYAELVRLRLRNFQKRRSLDVWWIEIVFCAVLEPLLSGMYILNNRAALSSCDLSAAFPLKKLNSFMLRLFSLSLFRKFVSLVLGGLVLPFWSSESSSNLFDLLSCSNRLLFLCPLLSLASSESSLCITSRLLSAFSFSALRELVSSALLATASNSLKRSASLKLLELGEPVASDCAFASASTSDSLRCRSTIFRRNSSSSWLSLAKTRSRSSAFAPTLDLDVVWNRCHHHPTWCLPLPGESSSSGNGSNRLLPRKQRNEPKLPPPPSSWSMLSSGSEQSSFSDSWSTSSSADRFRP